MSRNSFRLNARFESQIAESRFVWVWNGGVKDNAC